MNQYDVNEFDPDGIMNASEFDDWLEFFEQAGEAVKQFSEFPDDRAYEIVDLLWQYCDRKQKAMIARKYGDTPLALFHERACDSIYSALPDSAKW